MPAAVRRTSFVVVVIATLGNLVLVGAAALDAPWILDRVASGQFSSLPAGLRVAYGLMFVLMVAQVWFAWLLLQRGGAWSRTSGAIAMAAVAVYLLSALVNMISPTPAERWNAIPAAVLAACFWILRRRTAQTPLSNGEVG